MTEAALENNITEILSDIKIPISIHAFVLAWVNSENKKHFETLEAKHQANEAALQQSLKLINGLIQMRANNLITDFEYQEQRKTADEETKRLKELINSSEDNNRQWLSIADDMLTFSEYASQCFNTASPELKRGILQTLGRNLSLKEKRLDLQKGNWIEPIKQIAKKVNRQIDPSEPVLSLYNMGKLELLLDNSLLCCLLWDLRKCFTENPDLNWFPIVDNWRKYGFPV